MGRREVSALVDEVEQPAELPPRHERDPVVPGLGRGEFDDTGPFDPGKLGVKDGDAVQDTRVLSGSRHDIELSCAVLAGAGLHEDGVVSGQVDHGALLPSGRRVGGQKGEVPQRVEMCCGTSRIGCCGKGVPGQAG